MFNSQRLKINYFLGVIFFLHRDATTIITSMMELYWHERLPNISLEINRIIDDMVIANSSFSFFTFCYNNTFSKMIVVSSRNRIAGHVPSKFRFKLKNAIQRKYSLAFATVPQTDPILSTANNKLAITIGGSESTISFSTTIYTVAEFISDFQTKLNAVSYIFTVTQHASNNKLVISRTGTGVIAFTPYPINAESISFYILGLYFQTSIIGASGSQCTFDGPLNIAQPNAYRIRINDIANVEDKGSYSSFYIPIDVNVFDVVNYKSADYFEQTIHFTKPTRNSGYYTSQFRWPSVHKF